LDEVAAAYPDDAILMSIVADSRGICDRLDSGASVTEIPPAPEMVETPPAP